MMKANTPRWISMTALVALAIALGGCATRREAPKDLNAGRTLRSTVVLGFIVNDLNLPWYQTQLKTAEEKCKELNCEIMPFEARTEKAFEDAITAIAAKQGRGMMIAAGNPMIGERIVALSEKFRIKIMAIDSRMTTLNVAKETKYLDQAFVGPDYRAVGNEMGKALLAEMEKRGWNKNEVAVAGLKIDSALEGSMRAKGSEEVLLEAGIPLNRIFLAEWPAPQTAQNAQSTASQLFGRGGGATKWLIYGYNDTATIAMVRAAEARGISAENMIAIGATGFGAAQEFARPNSGFFASAYVSPKKQAEEAVEKLYRWAKSGSTADTLPSFQPIIMLTRENYQEQLKGDGLL